MDLLEFEYNILNKVGVFLGFKYNKEILDFFKNICKLSEEVKGNLFLVSIGRILFEEIKLKIFSKRKGIKFFEEIKVKISKFLKGIYVGEKLFLFGCIYIEEIKVFMFLIRIIINNLGKIYIEEIKELMR